MPGTSTPLTTCGCACYGQSASRASGIGIKRSGAIDNDSKSFALGALDLWRNQAGGYAAQIRLVFGGPLQKSVMPADVLVSEEDCFTEAVQAYVLFPSAVRRSWLCPW